MIKKIAYTLILIFSITKLFSQEAVDFYNINNISDIRIYFKEHNWDAILDSLFQLGKDDRLLGDVIINGRSYHNAGIRYKGYSSWSVNQVKNPFYIKLDESIKYQNYEGFSKIKLSNVTHDPSFIREVLSYEIARKYMPAGRASFANVYVNDTLIGLYSNVEAVDDNFTLLHFDSEGNSFIKGSPSPLVYPYGDNANLAYLGSDSSDYGPYYELESEYGWNDLMHLTDVLNHDTSNLGSILNIDRTLWMHAFDYALVNLDSYIGYSQNYYLYKDDNGIFNPIIWDLNMSFGGFRYSDATNTNLTINEAKQLDPLGLLYLTSTMFSARPLIKNILQNPTNKKMFLAHIRTIINENFKNNEYYTLGTQYQNIIRTSVQNDPNKFYSYSYFVKNIDTTVGPTSNQYPGIKDLMTARMAYLDSFPGFQGYPDIEGIYHYPETPNKGQPTWFTANVTNANKILLGFRNNSKGVFQKTEMFDDGLHNDSLAGDHIYGAGIIPAGNILQYFVYSENDSAGIFSPERAEYEFYTLQTKIQKGDLVINELCNDWMELFNNTHETINLSGLHLSDEAAFLSKWSFPDTSVGAKKYVIVRTNENVTSSLHSNFTLNKKGGALYFSDNSGQVIDSINYGEEVPGRSIGRYPNGIGQFVYMRPSFSYCNNLGESAALDFSIYPNPAKDNVYIEINNSGFPINVEIIDGSGRTVANNEVGISKVSMPRLSLNFDISKLNSGVYTLKIISTDKILTKKFIII